LRIIVIAIGTAGDVHPLLGLSRTFANNGHKVLFCTSPVFSSVVERYGLRFLPLGTVEQYRSTVDDPNLWKARTSLKVLWAGVARTIRPLFDLMAAEVDRNTIIAGHPWAFGARFFQEKYAVPMVTLQVSPSTFLSAKKPPIHKQLNIPMFLPYAVRAGLLWALEHGVLDQVCGPDINRMRAQLGLRPVRRIMSHWMYSPQGVLGLFPEWFAPPQSDWPSTVQLTGFPLFDDATGREIDGELEEFLAAGDKPVVFTPGSTLVDESSYYCAATTALESLSLRGIFLGMKDVERSRQKAHVLARSFVPLSKLLPRARALVHHGGIGTVSHAFAAGIPQFITPFAHDQFDNAARVVKLGCGISSQKPICSDNIAKALTRLLRDSSIQRRCVEVRSMIEPGDVTCQKSLRALDEIASKTLLLDRSESLRTHQPVLTSA
jgi:rhamnosyltransferase subunit B